MLLLNNLFIIGVQLKAGSLGGAALEALSMGFPIELFGMLERRTTKGQRDWQEIRYPRGRVHAEGVARLEWPAS